MPNYLEITHFQRYFHFFPDGAQCLVGLGPSQPVFRIYITNINVGVWDQTLL